MEKNPSRKKSKRKIDQKFFSLKLKQFKLR